MRQREILCIDDDDQSLEVRKILLETFDFHVTTAKNGREGLKLFKSHNVDAVVVDYQMPGMDGGEVAREVKDLRPEVPVLVLSALPWLPEEAPRKCIDAFLTKGGPTDKLVHEIEQLVGNAPPGRRPGRGLTLVGALLRIVVEKLRGLVRKPKEEQPRAKMAQVARVH